MDKKNTHTIDETKLRENLLKLFKAKNIPIKEKTAPSQESELGGFISKKKRLRKKSERNSSATSRIDEVTSKSENSELEVNLQNDCRSSSPKRVPKKKRKRRVVTVKAQNGDKKNSLNIMQTTAQKTAMNITLKQADPQNKSHKQQCNNTMKGANGEKKESSKNDETTTKKSTLNITSKKADPENESHKQQCAKEKSVNNGRAALKRSAANITQKGAGKKIKLDDHQIDATHGPYREDMLANIDGDDEDIYDSDESCEPEEIYDSEYSYDTEDDDSFDFGDSSDYNYSDDTYETESSDESYEFDDDYNTDDYFWEQEMDENNECSNKKNFKEAPEDLIIHRGTAEKRCLAEEDDIQFDSDNEDPQVIELAETLNMCKRVKQYDVYSLQSLKALNDKFVYSKKKFTQPDSDDSDPCPNLVPIQDSDLDSYDDMSSGSLESFYEEVSDDDSSFCSIDVNRKYMLKTSEDDSDEVPPMQVDIISAPVSKQIKSIVLEESTDEENGSLIEQLTSQQLFDNVDNECTNKVISTTIIKPNENSFDSPNSTIDQGACDEVGVTSDICPETREETQIIESQPTSPTQAVMRNIFFNAINSNKVLVLLKEAFYIYGTVKLTLLNGSIEVYGHTPDVTQQLKIFSPRGCSLVQVSPNRCVRKNTLEQLQAALLPFAEHFKKADFLKISDNYDFETDALLLLERNLSAKKLVNNFKKFMSENVFPNLNSMQMERPFYASEYLLQCVINSESDKALKMPSEWSQLPVTRKTVMVIAGGKSVGKSTLVRYTINRNLKKFPRILLIDLDIGQPEIFVPQTISCTTITEPLIGPGFFQNRQPDKAFAIGHTNITLCALTYMHAVNKLITYCKTEAAYKDIPWIVNTMGYNQGFGLELLACVCDYLIPTDVVQLHSNKEINNFDIQLKADILPIVKRIIYTEQFMFPPEITMGHKWHLHHLDSALRQESRYMKDWAMSPKDTRYAMIISRLSSALQDNAEWLTDCKPLCGRLSDIKVVNMTSEDDERDTIIAGIEANMVYLCDSTEDNVPPECFGIGVVRGIDFHVNQVYLIPAMDSSLLNKVNCLAIGDIPLPTSIFTNQGPKVKNTAAPFVFNTVDASDTKAIKQIYHRPPEFLSGLHKQL